MPDAMDRQIIRALQCSARAPFARIAEAVGASEQTVARRYQALVRSGVVRVHGRVTPASYGQVEWVARIACRPDRVGALAEALVRRPEVSFARLASGGSEIICLLRSSASDSGDTVLLKELPRTSAVLNLHIDMILHGFGTGLSAEWNGYGGHLTAEQQALLTAGTEPPSGPYREITDEDRPLLAALAEDGRATHARLAAETGWSKGRVLRRLAALEESGTLAYDVDLLSEPLGHHLHATLWLRVPPHRLEAVGEEIARHDQIAFAGAISGPHNIMAIAICRDTDDLYRFLTRQIASIPDIVGYEVSIRVRGLKQAGSLITGGRLAPAPGPYVRPRGTGRGERPRSSKGT